MPRTATIWLALAAAVWSLAVVGTGGFVWEAGPFHLSSQNPIRPALLSAALLAWHVFRYGRSTTLTDILLIRRHAPRPPVIAGISSVVVFVVGTAYGLHAVGGSDSYGYLSQADLWLHGGPKVEQAFVGEFPWPNAAFTMTPLGYAPTGQAGNYVPVYPPGFPLTLAAFMVVGGEAIAFLVVPLLGGIAVWLTYRLGCIVADESVGAIAALWLLVSPAFLFMLMSGPMSDIPAMTWWLLATILVAHDDSRNSRLAISGLAVSIAILTRPNLVLLGVLFPALIVAMAPTWKAAGQRVVMWLVPALIGPLALAYINHWLYGSPMRSGYGNFSTMFALSHFWPNLQRYSSWLLDSQTPFIFAGLVSPLFLWKSGASRRSRVLIWWCLAFVAGVAGSYLWYSVFDAWWFVRFLLPAYPVLLVLAAASAAFISRRSRRFGHAVLVLVTVVVFTRCLVFAYNEMLFRIADGEYRYREAGERAKLLPPNTVVIAFLHSGSVRHYGNVLTLRYDMMPPEWLDKAIGYLSSAGHPVYAVLDSWEVDEMRKLFGSTADLSWLSRQPMDITSRGVRIYEVSSAIE